MKQVGRLFVISGCDKDMLRVLPKRLIKVYKSEEQEKDGSAKRNCEAVSIMARTIEGEGAHRA